MTRADLAAHHILVDGLRRLTGDVPVVSEEDPESVAVGQRLGKGRPASHRQSTEKSAAGCTEGPKAQAHRSGTRTRSSTGCTPETRGRLRKSYGQRLKTIKSFWTASRFSASQSESPGDRPGCR